MDDLITEFLTETSESLAVLDQELVRFEQNPNDRDILMNIFRLMHTIKGTCGFLGLPRLETVAHAGEDVLGKFRDGALPVTPEAVTVILASIDRIRELLQALETSGQEPAGDDNDLTARLRAIADGGPTSPAPEFSGPGPSTPPASIDPGAVVPFPVAAELLAEVEQALAVGVASSVAPGTEARIAPHHPGDADIPAEADQRRPAPAADGGRAGSATPASAQTIRVHVDVLENLMTLVSEMVLTRNNLLQLVRGKEDSEFAAPLQRLSLITSDLQEGIMKTRMQPIGNAWSKLPRVVRDLSMELGKKIDLKMIGAETELDRQVLEKIKDPLTHMVRNAADHGIERPDDRKAAGKPDDGTITLRAYHEGGHIIIEISDDGRGLNMARIRRKIVEKGLASEAEIAGMDEVQLQQFILRPGFSTAEKVTNVSGRGVGMDVVKTNIDEIGGTIQFKSIEGKGSTFTIKIPLTLAIVSALIVECASERFAIPQLSVRELVRLSATSELKVETINDSPVLRLRSRLLPLVPLRGLLALGPDDGRNAQECYVVVTQVGAYDFGIIVDRVFDTEEIVVKPVAPVLRDIPYYSGNTILGDGSVIMILDPNGLASNAGQKAVSAHESDRDGTKHGRKTASLLVFRAGGEERKAVPMALVARIEAIDPKSVEIVNGQRVVQYRNHLMPLINVSGQDGSGPAGKQIVLVFSDDERSMGLVVEEIVDIVDDHIDVELASERAGLIGSAVIGGKATEIVDVGHFLTLAHRDWFGLSEGSAVCAGQKSVSRRVLIVDDSPFFRSLLTPYLSAAGLTVTDAENAEEALKLRDQGLMFDVIVSDIEMPGMNGFDFARAVASDPRWQGTPMLALSATPSPQNLEQGRKAGFRKFVPKVRRTELLSAINDVLASWEAAA